MKSPNSPASASSRITTGHAAVAADRTGNTVPIESAPRRRLLELQAELEKSQGPRKVQVQREIERMQKADTTIG